MDRSTPYPPVLCADGCSPWVGTGTAVVSAGRGLRLQVNRAALQTPRCVLAGQSPPPRPPHRTTGWVKTPDYLSPPHPSHHADGETGPGPGSASRNTHRPLSELATFSSSAVWSPCPVSKACPKMLSPSPGQWPARKQQAGQCGRRPGRARWVHQDSQEPCTCLLPLWEKFHSLSFSCLFLGEWGCCHSFKADSEMPFVTQQDLLHSTQMKEMPYYLFSK